MNLNAGLFALSLVISVITGIAATPVLVAFISVITGMAATPVLGINYERCFRPGPTSCTALVVKEIDSATRTVDFEAYSLTDHTIIDALDRAAVRGVKVRSVVDRESALAKLLPGEIWTDCAVAIHHSKVVIVDGQSVGTGSFNFSRSAEQRNAENHIWLHDASIAAAYEADFADQISMSVPGVGCR